MLPSTLPNFSHLISPTFSSAILDLKVITTPPPTKSVTLKFDPSAESMEESEEPFFVGIPVAVIVAESELFQSVSKLKTYKDPDPDYKFDEDDVLVPDSSDDQIVQLPSKSFKLPTSKSPIMEAMVYCALRKWGLEILHNDRESQRIVFRVNDFEQYYNTSCLICSKQTPSEDMRARAKALQRWFISFPSKKDMLNPFPLTVKIRQYKKVREIIERLSTYKGVTWKF